MLAERSLSNTTCSLLISRRIRDILVWLNIQNCAVLKQQTSSVPFAGFSPPRRSNYNWRMKPNQTATEYCLSCLYDNHFKGLVCITALAHPTSPHPFTRTQIHSHLALLVPFVWFPAYVETLSQQTVKRKVLIMFWTPESMQAHISVDTDICAWYSSFTLLSKTS